MHQKAVEGECSRLIKDDILISITDDLGIIGVVTKNFEEAYIIHTFKDVNEHALFF
jgi:hypothetical protein